MKNIKSHILTLWVVMLCVTTLNAQTNPAREKYIRDFQDIAIEQMHKTGIPASITLAQACLESGDGTSYLAKEGNNHFGIKCHGWKGKTIRYDDDRKNECFRKYDSAEESFRDHSDFLVSGGRYAFLFDLEPTDYKGWAKGLKKAGYATNPNYAERLIRIIEEYQLYRLDRPEAAEPTGCNATAESEIVRKHFLYKYSTRHQLYRNNGTVFIIASGFDTYESLAKEYCLFEREIRKFNDVDRKERLNAGEVVYLQKKRKRSQRRFKTHTLLEGQDIHFVSQRYGIRMEFLIKRNNSVKMEKSAIIELR